MLETLVRSVPLSEETGIRAALYLARDHGREDMREALVEAATGGKREEFRGMAAAALWDASPPSDGSVVAGSEGRRARLGYDELLQSRTMGNVAWGALIRAASKGGYLAGEPLLTETPYRWIQWGWLE